MVLNSTATASTERLFSLGILKIHEYFFDHRKGTHMKLEVSVLGLKN